MDEHISSSQELIDRIGVMILGLDRRGRISLINSAGAALLGGKRSDLLGLDWFGHFIPPGDRDRLRAVFEQIMSGDLEPVAEHENFIQTLSGDRRLIGWHNTLCHDGQGEISGVLCTGEDITRRYEADQALRKSRDSFRRFVDHGPDAFFIFDRSGRFVDVNRQACQRLGYSREELLALSVSDIDDKFTPERVREALAEMERSGGPMIFLGLHRCKDGETFPVEVKVDLFEQQERPLFIGVARDISDRIRQERKLRESQDLLRVIIDAIPEIICIKDGQGRWLLANTYDLELFGLTEVDYRGRTDAELSTFAEPCLRESLLYCMETDEQAWQAGKPTRAEERIRRPDGVEVIFDVFKIPLFDQQGNRRALVVTGRDVTESRQRHEQYRRLFEESPLPYLSLDPLGRVQVVNQATCDLFGFERKEVEGQPITDFLTEKSARTLRENYPRFVQGAPFSGNDYEMRCRDGRIVVCQVTARVVRDTKGRPVQTQCILCDVTRQRKLEQELRENEERYRLLFERSPVGILLYDTELRITDCNERFAEIVGTDRERLLGWDMATLKDTRLILPALRSALAGSEARVEGEYETTFSGQTLYATMRTAPLYESDGRIRGGVAIIEDLTEQHRVEIEKSRFMSAIEQASEAIMITDLRPVVLYVNPAFETQTGYRFDEVKGKNPGFLRSGRHDPEFYARMWKILSQGRVWRGHLTNRRKDGSLFEVDATISPVRNDEGEVVNFVALTRDISREVILERQLHQAQKMEAIGTLAGGIAHDFNNILSAVLGYAEMVEVQLPQDSPVRKDVAQIIAAAHRATDLVRQILTFSRQEEDDLRPVKVQFVVKEALKLLRSSLPATIELRETINSECGSVQADSTRIHQILINLCTNAKQALGPRGGVIQVTLDELDSPDLPVDPRGGPSVDKGRWLVLEVSDNGSGIDPDILDRIFDPFFTTKKKGEGTGLGLSVVHGIVKGHGGEITVNSQPGKGTVFRVYLPVIDDEETGGETAEQSPIPGGDERIVVVDDDDLLVEIMERNLGGLGYRVTGFTDSKAAFDYLSRHVREVDLLITDMTMPHLTGDELTRRILSIRPDLPVILCTGYSEYIGPEEARALGVREFINKPVDNLILAGITRRILDEQARSANDH